MSQYAVNDGTRVKLVAPSGGVTAGAFVAVGGFFGVAMGTALAGADFILAVGGTYTAAPKVAGTAWTAGDLVSWVTGSSAFCVSTTLDVQGVVVEDALSAATTGAVRLLDAPQDNPARLTAVEALAGAAATDAEVTPLKTETFVVPVPVEAGAVRSGYWKPGFIGTVVGVEIIASDKPTSAADGVTCSLRGVTGGAVVDAFDLTAIPTVTAAAEALTLTANVAFTATSVFYSVCIAGADVVGGKDVTLLVKVTRA